MNVWRQGDRGYVWAFGRDVQLFPVPTGAAKLGEGGLPVLEAFGIVDRRLFRADCVHRGVAK